MPKKRNQSYFSKPPTSAHPSISIQQNDSHRDEESDKSVNDLLQHLRLSQASSLASTVPRSDLNPQTVHPSLKHILQIAEKPPLTLRPRTRAMATQGRRRPPGPPPPRSWLVNSIHTSARSVQTHSSDLQQRPSVEKLGALPNLHLPPTNSLQHLTLVLIAKNWDFHVQYDQYYLPLLPTRYKQLLLTYIARYGSHGINAQGLCALFADESIIEDSTGIEGLTHLDLSVSIGRSITLKDLKQFITTTFATPAITESTPESWDLPTSLSPVPIRTLTHLFLSFPPPSVSWRHFLQLSPHLNTLTHLALSHWPPPTLTPNSTTAYRSSPSGDIAYGDHDLYSVSLDDDFSGAANVLRQLSRDTYCLQWLDLSGCSFWLPALAWRKGEGGIDWDGPWSGITTIVVAQDYIPECLKSPSADPHWKEVLKYAGEDPRLERSQRELRAWARTEGEIETILKRIRGEKVSGRAAVVGRVGEWSFSYQGRGRGGRQIRRRTEYDDGDGDEIPLLAGEGGRKNIKGQNVNRTKKVEFERGWEGWWIEDCLRGFSIQPDAVG
ncbi:MAG: hypothetical protein Q9178_005188 [Gyalolechia marmorata]